MKLDRPSFGPNDDLSLVWRDDGFSLQVSSKRDRFFWIRAEPPVGAEIAITDLTLGDIPQEDAADVLAELLERLGAMRSLRLRFADIGAADDHATAREIQRLREIVEVYAARRRIFITGIAERPRGDKLDLLIELRNFTTD